MQLSPISLAITRLGGVRFSPAALFPSGTAGAWYDPSDASTLFSDTAGTTPSPTPGGGALSVVGLMLDKSQGLALGSELLTNGNFANGTTSWTIAATGTATVTSGVIRITSVTGRGTASQAITTVVGQQYRISLGSISNGNAGATSAIVRVTSTNSYSGTLITSASSTSANGFLFFTATTTTTYIWLAENTATPGNYVEFGGLSIKSDSGNHAISYNTTTARPELSARVNLLTYSEQFDNAAWTKDGLNAFGSGSVANTSATTDPLGGNTADYIQENTALSKHRAYQALGSSGVSYAFSCYLKAGQRTWAYLNFGDITNRQAWFDLANGVVGTVSAGLVASIQAAGNGWYRCTITRTASAVSPNFDVGIATADNVHTYTGDGTSGIYIWGADLRPANIGTSVPAYQRIADQYTYDSSGFPRYLVFNGTASGMYTPANLNLSTTDKATVFAGVRKTTTSTGIVAETSAIASSNNGAFLGLGTDSGGIEFFAGSRGTAYIEVFGDSASYTSPFSAVTTAAFNIAAPSAQLRVNAVVTETDVGSQGTGNYGSYPLNIGGRNVSSGTPSFPFPGYLYSLIVVGAASTAAQISSTESWINVKEGTVY